MDGRRSIRRSVVLPVMLSGTDFSGTAFKENTWTIGVNRHGAKISTAYKLAVGDQIVVGNPVLGQSAKARVIRVAEKGRAFEIGVELLEAHDVWGAKSAADDDNRSPDNGGGTERSDSAARTPQSVQVDSLLKPVTQETPATPADLPQPTNSPSPTVHPNKEEGANPHPERHFDSLAGFLRSSRTELDSLLARTQEIQKLGSQAVQSLLEAVHSKLHQELEAAAAGFENETRQRLEHTASETLESFASEANARQAALLEEGLTRSRAAREQIELSFKEGAEEYQKKLAASSQLALEDLRLKGKGLFESFRNDLEKTLEDAKKKGKDDIEEGLRRAAGDLADELRRRADVGFEILNEQLTRAAKVLVEQIEQQIAALRQSALGDLARSASEAVSVQVGLGVKALDEAAERSRSSLESHLQQSLANFEKQIGQLTSAALEKNNQTSEFLLHDLQRRLDQAARALQRTVEATGLD